MIFSSPWKWSAALVLGAGILPADRAPEAPSPPWLLAEADGPIAAGKVEAGPLPVAPTAPGYFDFPPRDRGDGTPPLPPIRPGQRVAVEVLIALPGRPIGGERPVRPDGTIGLGFYGDIPVAGLNRVEAKIRVLEHLRKFLDDETLGLFRGEGPDGRIMPADSNRVFVRDDLDFPRSYASRDRDYRGKAKVGQVIRVEALQALPGRPIAGLFVVGPDGSINLGFYGDVQVAGLDRPGIKARAIDQLRKHLSDEALGLVADGGARAIPPAESARVLVDDVVPAPEGR